ncbi:hypothetical protein [Paenibacillus hexagrammi]|uniref:Uncharacterized protein n=1 Tax=Paenibacillus hexagrammi TaxID=2908839 RepID=A0ABY3SMP0_9BACL|nr:hypothetical protein [Paenibacillus sp. YPD9-1]UJF35264.1 hypothetical protein L0M14_09185 [Paenibacillus sp. YPD9-1]
MSGDQDSDRENKKNKGMFYTRDHIQLYEIDTAWPDHRELYPDLEEIPSGWLKDCREYHAATRKDMIRKAIEWKSFIKLREEGRERLIVPKALYEERTGWSLIGFENHKEVTLAGDAWEQMQIVLPGINDEEKEESL